MSIVGKALGLGIEGSIKAVGGLVDELYTSKEEKLTHAEVMQRIYQRPRLAQIAVNQTEATHRTIFVAGWRPAVGWVCVAVLAYNWILRPLFNDMLTLAGHPLPDLDVDLLEVIALLGSMLGIGAMRTIDKANNKAV